jgi:hypothetical protein
MLRKDATFASDRFVDSIKKIDEFGELESSSPSGSFAPDPAPRCYGLEDIPIGDGTASGFQMAE